MRKPDVWRITVTLVLVLAGVMTVPVVAQGRDERHPADLAAMMLSPAELGHERYQFARGGYLSQDDVRYLIEQRYDAADDVIDNILDGAGWRQGYTGTMVLLSDRANRTSDPVVAVTTTIHELTNADDATVMETLLSSSPPHGAEFLDLAMVDAMTWRVVTSQDDTLRTLARTGRFVIELETAHSRITPDAGEHAQVVAATLERVARVDEAGAIGPSQQLVLAEDPRLIPVAIATDAPLVHTWYRMLDGRVSLTARELDPPDDLPPGVTDIAIARQTAEIASQNWVTLGVVVARFESEAAACTFAGSGIIRDPLDIFPTSESKSAIDASEPGVTIEVISGETRVGGRYSGYRVSLAEDDRAAQMTIRSMGSTLIDREGVEAWALSQRKCLAGDPCESVSLTDMLQRSNPPSPVTGGDLDGVYESPVAPWRVTYGSAVWQVRDGFAEGGYDYLYLRSERMDATFETIVDHRGDPEQCVLNELERLRDDETHARISVGSDAAGPAGGLDQGHGWVIYTVEPLEDDRADEEYSIRLDCYTVVAGSTSLVVQTRAPRDVWPTVAPIGEELRAGIEIEGALAIRMTGGQLVVIPSWRSDDMIDRRLWTGLA